MKFYIATTLEIVNKFAESKKEDFLDILKNSTSESRITPEDKIIWIWYFGNVTTKEIREIEENRKEFLTMGFEERFEHELKKVRVSLGMKAGHFEISDRISNTEIPDEIKGIIYSRLIVTMNAEQSVVKDKEVMKTIPKPQKGKLKDELDENEENVVVTEKPTKKNDVDLSMDSILEKINEVGMEGLSDGEKEFLKKGK